MYIGCDCEQLEYLSMQNLNLNFETTSVFDKLINLKVILLTPFI